MLGLVIGCVGLGAGTSAYVVALGRLRRYERSHPSAWWFGYARDGVNLGAALVLFGAYAATGLGGPVALVLALAVMLATYLADWALGRWLGWARSAWLLTPVAAAGAVALALAGRPLGVWLGGLLRLVAPR